MRTPHDRHRLPASGALLALSSVAALGLVIAAPTSGSRVAQAREGENALPLAAPGMAFRFEVIESHDADYLGDTPAHLGKSGGLTVRPQVALGDPVYRKATSGSSLIGRITRVTWSRTAGSLEVEFDPEPFQRIAVGDEVWIDLNPPPAAIDRPGTP